MLELNVRFSVASEVGADVRICSAQSQSNNVSETPLARPQTILQCNRNEALHQASPTHENCFDENCVVCLIDHYAWANVIL